MHEKMFLWVCIVHAYIRLVGSLLFSGSTVVWYDAMECEVQLNWGLVHSILRTKCCAPAIVMQSQTCQSSLLLVQNALLVFVFLQFSGMGFLPSTPNHLKHGVHNARSAPVDLSYEPYHSISFPSEDVKWEIPSQ